YGYALRTLYDQLAAQPVSAAPQWMESAVNGSTAWELEGLTGQADYNAEAAGSCSLKTEVKRQLRAVFDIETADSNLGWLRDALWLIPRQIGWARLANLTTPVTYTTPDEVEYLMSRSYAHGVPIVAQAWLSLMANWPNRDSNLKLMKYFEQRRALGDAG